LSRTVTDARADVPNRTDNSEVSRPVWFAAFLADRPRGRHRRTP
jgi:hypothetical protein